MLIRSVWLLLVIGPELKQLNVGPLFHARWLTLVCKTLRLYVSIKAPTASLITLAKFCIQVYFPSWFEIKRRYEITSGCKNFFEIIKRVQEFPDKYVTHVCRNVLQRNSFFCHPENILIGMLADADDAVRSHAVEKF